MILPTDSATRKTYPVYSGFMAYFPKSIATLAHHSYKSNEKHNPGEDMHWDRDKSPDHLDCMARHMLDQLDVELDSIEEKTATAWRAMAELEIALEEKAAEDNNDGGRWEGFTDFFTGKIIASLNKERITPPDQTQT